MTTFTKPKTAGDVFVHYESVQSNLKPATLTNAAGTNNIPQVAGYPVSYNATTRVATVLLNAGISAGANALLVTGPAVVNGAGAAAGTKTEYTVIQGENVVVNQDALPANDSAGTAITVANVTGAAGLSGFRFVTEPATKATQTE